jgi:hypothetical protein
VRELQVQAPAMSTPTPEQFFANRGQDRTKPDVAFLKNHFYREGRLTEEQALWILHQGTELLRKEPNVLQVDAPITGAYTKLHFLICQNLRTTTENNLYSVW